MYWGFWKALLSFIIIGENLYGEVGVLVSISQTKGNVQSKYTEHWVPVKAISNGTIVLDNGYRVTGVKIRPRNIFILDYITQENVIIALKNFYNSVDFEFWMISADRPVDISSYLAKLQLLYNQANNPAVRKLISQDIQKANSFMDNNVTDNEYYILFKEKNGEAIQKKIRTLITGLANSGLDSTMVSNQDLRVILDNFLNGGVTTKFGTVISDEF